MLAVGSGVAQERVASSSQASTVAKVVTITDQPEVLIGEPSSELEGRGDSIGAREQPALRPDHAETCGRVAESFNFDYGDDRIERDIDERIIDRLACSIARMTAVPVVTTYHSIWRTKI